MFNIADHTYAIDPDYTCGRISQMLDLVHTPRLLVDEFAFAEYVTRESLSSKRVPSSEEVVNLYLSFFRPFELYVFQPHEVDGYRRVELRFGDSFDQRSHFFVAPGFSLREILSVHLGYHVYGFDLAADVELPLIGSGAGCPDILPVSEIAPA